MRKICAYCGRQLQDDNVCSFCGYKNTVFWIKKKNEPLVFLIVWAILSIIGIVVSFYTVSLFRKDLPMITPLAFVIPAFTIPKLIGAILKGSAPYVCQLIVIAAEIFLYCRIDWWQHKYYPGNLGLLPIFLLLYIFYCVIFFILL